MHGFDEGPCGFGDGLLVCVGDVKLLAGLHDDWLDLREVDVVHRRVQVVRDLDVDAAEHLREAPAEETQAAKVRGMAHLDLSPVPAVAGDMVLNGRVVGVVVRDDAQRVSQIGSEDVSQGNENVVLVKVSSQHRKGDCRRHEYLVNTPLVGSIDMFHNVPMRGHTT